MKSDGNSAIGRKAVAHLKKVDPVMLGVIEKVGSYKGWPASGGSHFDAVARSIVFQQLSGKAAGTIHGRFHGLYGGRPPLPAELATTSDEQLRAVGLSRQKSAYLKDLGARVASGEIPIETLHELTDEEIISALTQVKGIGRWTAQMFLMFRLGRLDVLPDLDLGIQKGRVVVFVAAARYGDTRTTLRRLNVRRDSSGGGPSGRTRCAQYYQRPIAS